MIVVFIRKTVPGLILICITAVSAAAATLDDVIALALRDNPKLRALEQEASMMKKRVTQKGSLEDPKLMLALNNLPADSFSFRELDMTSKEIGISQMIPLWGKLGLKERNALKEYMKSRETLREGKLGLLHGLRSDAYEIYYVRRSIDVLEEIRKQISLVIEGETANARAGTGSLANVVKANLELGMVDEELIGLRQRLTEKEEDLSYLAGSPVVLENADLPDPGYVDGAVETLERGMPESNPALVSLKFDFEIARNELTIKKREYFPDIDVGLSYMQRDRGPQGNRSDMVTGRVTLNIPFWFWKRNVPMVDEAAIDIERIKSRYADRANELRARMGTLKSNLRKWEKLHRLYRDTLIPQASLALQMNLGRYKTGSVDFMTMIDTLRLLTRFRKELYMTAKEYHTTYSEILTITGGEAAR